MYGYFFLKNIVISSILNHTQTTPNVKVQISKIKLPGKSQMVSHFSTIMPADPSVVDKLPTRMPWKVLEYPPDSPELSSYYKRAFLLLSL